MALHKRHTHGHVYRDEAAREQLAIRKRDSHGNEPVMHIPQGFNAQQKDGVNNGGQGVQVVYVTLSQTFSGPAYYMTLSSPPAQAPRSSQAGSAIKGGALQARPTPTSSVTSVSSAFVTPAKGTTSSATPAAIISSVNSSSSSSPTTLATSSRVLGTPLKAGQTSSSTSKASAEESSSSGMSSGGKAGLAFGIIFLIGALAGAVYFVLWRKKKQTAERNGEMMNEKHSSYPRPGFRSSGGIGAAAATGAFAAPATRQMDNSRPMDQGERVATTRDSVQTEKVPASVRSTRTTSTAPRLSLRPISSMPGFGGDQTSTGARLEGQPRDNPFNDGTQKARSISPPANPFDGASPASMGSACPQPSWQGADAAAAMPMAAGGAAPPRGPNNVHRVQLDFKPSMDDELELRSGQLVRMLHEYDDGWALCIRMDRSQQGVAPRTCLSKLPVKPRPQGPPPQSSRPGTANSNRGPPNAPGMMVPRPLTPSSSDSPASPPLRSEMRPSSESAPPASGNRPARKPVPGQAM